MYLIGLQTLRRAEAGLGARVQQLQEQVQAESAARQAAEALLSEERSARSAETSAWNEDQAARSVGIAALQEEVPLHTGQCLWGGGSQANIILNPPIAIFGNFAAPKVLGQIHK